MKKLLVFLISFAIIFGGFSPFITPVSAAAALSASRISTTMGGRINLKPGETKTVSIIFQNNGSTAWKNDGNGYISLYTYGPKYRVSVFDPGNWLSPSQVRRLSEPSVPANGTGTITFDLKAPSQVGTYQETFALAAENIAWVPGGEFTLTITVADDTTSAAVAQIPVATSTSIPKAPAQITAPPKIKVKAGKSVPISIQVKNLSTSNWKNLSLVDNSVAIASTAKVSFAHKTWSGSRLALVDSTIKPGETVGVPFFITAPTQNGTHNAKFNLSINDQITSTQVIIPIEVTGGSGEAINAPVVEEVPAAVMIAEPIIRVGVLIVDEETDYEVKIGSDQSIVDLTDESGKVLATIPAGDSLRAAYEDDGLYHYGSGKSEKTSTTPLRFVPQVKNAVLTIYNFDRRLTRDTEFANNTFRNILELRYNKTKDRAWIINELPIEYYLRGLAETSNSSPMEFQKALMTAARTYALYHWSRSTKHRAEGYHVDAYRDQVYWGYGQEERNPKITEGVEATRGQVVTYQGEAAVTPYFSRSAGHTLNWNDVWGGDVPYVIGVDVPCDHGKTLWGHGVGMSASGAICMAKEGQTWDSILKYFYTGIDIEKKWE